MLSHLRSRREETLKEWGLERYEAGLHHEEVSKLQDQGSQRENVERSRHSPGQMILFERLGSDEGEVLAETALAVLSAFAPQNFHSVWQCHTAVSRMFW